jgi:EAL domain-containing protein (putative c-di-GMP-specific phosphodiesterase class I)
VETPEDLRALVKMQCDTAQGFLFGKPMPAAKLATMLLACPAASMQILAGASSADPHRLAG